MKTENLYILTENQNIDRVKINTNSHVKSF